MTAFKLKKKESAKKGIRRVAHDRAEDAVGLLRDEEADPIEAVHEARKDLKKLRATLKLVRPLIGDKTYGRENARFRDAGRALSDVRDAQVRAQTIDALAKRFSDDPPPGGWWTLRALLVDDASGNGALESLREQLSDEIERGDQAIEDWPLGANGFDLLGPGLKRAYSRGRRRFRDARKDPSDERLHEWRKRSKDLWYHLRLVRRAWPEVMTTTADEAHELSTDSATITTSWFSPPTSRMPGRHSPRTARAPAQADRQTAQGTSGRGVRVRRAPVRREAKAVRRADRALLGRGQALSPPAPRG